jgi:NADH-quinone oxidoreductase subunit G
VVVLWSERLAHGPRGKQTVNALLALARALHLETQDGGGFIEVPALSATNARGLREVGCLPNLKGGLQDADAAGIPAPELPAALGGDVSTILLFQADPVRFAPDGAAWAAGLESANTVIGFSDFVTQSLADQANVIFPAESYAEKEGTVTHPDGRVQRVRQTIGHPGEVRPVWWSLEQILGQLGSGTGALTAPMVSEQIFKAVPFYDGLTLEEIGGRGVRWPEREAASKLEAPELPDGELSDDPPAAGEANGRLRLGSRPSLWTGYVTRHAPVLQFLKPEQTVELSPADAERLGVGSGTPVRVGVNGTRLNATVALRAQMPEGTAYLIDGTEDDPAGSLVTGAPQTVEVSKG